jgi:hypothetical protein
MSSQRLATNASASVDGVPPFMASCVDLETLDHVADDDANMVNVGWAQAGRMEMSAPAVAATNPGFEAGAAGWKFNGATASLTSYGSQHAYAGDAYLHFIPTQPDATGVGAHQITVTPSATASPRALEFRAVISDADGSASGGGLFLYQVAWRKISYGDFPPGYNCGPITWPSMRNENVVAVEGDVEVSPVQSIANWNGWGNPADQWIEVVGSEIPTGVPYGSWDAIEVTPQFGTDAGSGSGFDPLEVLVDDLSVTVWED